ncbi:adenylyl-sulfate kinase [Burkholderia plantarii]|uniref:adenylyl-sulfate kinase n=1 Tax=Burkholderia plantarii TaxID=41899 RepID=UPI0034E1E29E|nr:adenylyl-sulfate kinase [Burkholderia plantarii]
MSRRRARAPKPVPGRPRAVIGEPYREVYVDTALGACEAREPKGPPARTRRGAPPGFTGPKRRMNRRARRTWCSIPARASATSVSTRCRGSRSRPARCGPRAARNRGRTSQGSGCGTERIVRHGARRTSIDRDD